MDSEARGRPSDEGTVVRRLDSFETVLVDPDWFDGI